MGEPLRIGLVGCGNIGGILARAVSEGRIKGTVSALHDLDERRASALSATMENRPPVCSLDGLIDRSDVVVEAAVPAVVPHVVRSALLAKRDVMCMSVGGFLGNEDLFDLARTQGRRIYIPSGAIGGLDAVKAAMIAGVERVVLTTRKPPQSLAGAQIVVQKGLDLAAIREPLVIFEGPALEAVKYFPVNLNVSATLSLAGIGPEATLVRVVADPTLTRNVHEIEVIGEFGRLLTRTENVPSPDNPRTSYLGALSAVATLKRITDAVQIGT